MTITVADLSPFSLGVLIALYERTVGLYASLVGVNAYHQPGVEAGKKAAAAVLQLQKRAVAHLAADAPRAATAPEIAAALGVPGEAETLFRILRHLAANPGRGIASEGTGDPVCVRFRAL